MTSKVTTLTDSPTTITEIVDYTYNLQNRLETVTTAGVLEDLDSDTYDDDRYVEVTSYTYSPSGIRASADITRYDVTDYGEAGEAWAELSSSTTDYLIDPYNHTGHAQVLEETTDGVRTTYTIGDDVIAQCATGGTTEYLLYDGHGSTRQLANSSGTVIDGQNYSYDGYGVMLSDSTASGADVAANAATSMLYAGEQYDSSAAMYYNRARYYNPSNGLFNRVDPYAGSLQDPQSLHKYAYCHNNPINGIDPSGMFEFSLTGILSVVQIVGTIMSVAAPALITLGAAGSLGAVLDTPPDATVVSVSASYIFKSLGKGFGGMGLEGTYEMLWIKALGRWQDYWSWGGSAGTTGGSASLEAGLVWNVKEVGDYEKLFLSATYGGAPFNLPFPGLSQGGMGVSVFWSPTGAKARGFKMGPIASTGMLTASGTVSWYTAGGPFSMGKDVVNWFNNNIPAPNLANTQDVRNLIDSVKEKLYPLPQY